jgi:two-component sensor histidine kinase/ligand-binding sensor protein
VPTRVELLDPESWGNVLEVYARTVNMAVALVDHQGHLIGKCHNPQPIWKLAREARPDGDAGCLFCLDSNGRSNGQCTAAADALRTGSVTLASGPGGFVHIAASLSLDGQHLGTLIAGQVFDQYPELLLMERFARQFGLSGQLLWQVARMQTPVSLQNLTTYGKLLGKLGNAFVRERHSNILQSTLASTNRQLQSANENLSDVNSKLSVKVAELAQSNAEKDVLLSEVHHRVNNNLQVISSLLRMQAAACPDDEVALALHESELRIESMALIHAQLYNSVDWHAVDFARYTAVLAENLFRSYGIDAARITLRVEIGNFELGVDRAIAAGLILNELISNALKHAFPGHRTGSIVIEGRLREGRIELSVQDDGAGIREMTGARAFPSLGLTIVNILCRQLKGTFAQPSDAETPGPGSIFRLSFPYESALATTVPG